MRGGALLQRPAGDLIPAVGDVDLVVVTIHPGINLECYVHHALRLVRAAIGKKLDVAVDEVNDLDYDAYGPQLALIGSASQVEAMTGLARRHGYKGSIRQFLGGNRSKTIVRGDDFDALLRGAPDSYWVIIGPEGQVQRHERLAKDVVGSKARIESLAITTAAA